MLIYALMSDVKSIKITNPAILKLVRKHAENGDKTATRIAERLIIRGATLNEKDAGERIGADTAKQGEPLAPVVL